MTEWISIKAAILAWSGIGSDALHICIGFAGSAAAGLVLRRPLSDPAPWLCVLLIGIANEGATGLADGMLEKWELTGSVQDLWKLMLAPTALLMVCRFAPGLVSPKRGKAPTQRISQQSSRHFPGEIVDAEFSPVED